MSTDTEYRLVDMHNAQNVSKAPVATQNTAIANGVSCEEASVSVNSEGNQVFERLLERGVLLPAGQGVQIQQAVQQVISADSGLGKRNTDQGLEKVEIRRLNLECHKLQVENEQLEKQYGIDNDQLEKQYAMDTDQMVITNHQMVIANKFVTANSFMSTMQLLDPL